MGIFAQKKLHFIRMRTVHKDKNILKGWKYSLTHYLLVSSADNLCKQIGPRSGPTKYCDGIPVMILQKS